MSKVIKLKISDIEEMVKKGLIESTSTEKEGEVEEILTPVKGIPIKHDPKDIVVAKNKEGDVIIFNSKTQTMIGHKTAAELGQNNSDSAPLRNAAE